MKTSMVLFNTGEMGKSTLLKIEAGSTAQAEHQKLLANQATVDEVIFPLFLRLSDLAKAAGEIFDTIPNLVQRDYPRTATSIQSLLREKLSNGKCMLLFDALDEVPIDYRNRLIENLERFTRNYPCQMIFTSRIVGSGDEFKSFAKEVEIVPFSAC